METEEQLKERYYKIFSDFGTLFAKANNEFYEKLHKLFGDYPHTETGNLSYEIPYEIKPIKKW